MLWYTNLSYGWGYSCSSLCLMWKLTKKSSKSTHSNWYNRDNYKCQHCADSNQWDFPVQITVGLKKLKKMLKELLMIWWYNMPSHVPFRSSAKHIKLLCIKSSKAEQNANEFYIYRVQTYYLHVNFHEVENIKPRPIAVVVILRSASDKLVVAAFFIICVSSESLLKSSPVLVTSKNAISCGGISLESMSDPGCRTISAKFCTKQTCLPGLWDDWTSPS